MLQVLPNGKYNMTKKANADTKRRFPALSGVTGGVLTIAGLSLSSVSKYDIATDSWLVGLPPLNKARERASACALKAKIYVFCGKEGSYALSDLNSIEVISETSLVPNSTACWQLIEVSKNILTRRVFPAVAPLNETEIAILGGDSGLYKSRKGDVIVLNTETLTCKKVLDCNYKFKADANQCVQVCNNRVVALVKGDDYKTAVISWTKGESAVTIHHCFNE